jgi:hypothetical protein
MVSGAALRLKYSTGDELRILCRKRCFLAILDEINLRPRPGGEENAVTGHIFT